MPSPAGRLVCPTCYGHGSLWVQSEEFPTDPPMRMVCCSCDYTGSIASDETPSGGQLHADGEAAVLAKYSTPGLQKVEMLIAVKREHLASMGYRGAEIAETLAKLYPEPQGVDLWSSG